MAATLGASLRSFLIALAAALSAAAAAARCVAAAHIFHHPHRSQANPRPRARRRAMPGPAGARPPWAGENYDWWQAMKGMNQSTYQAARVRPGLEPQLDGNPFGAAWEHAPWTELFQDIQGALQPPPRLETRVSMLLLAAWVLAWATEPAAGVCLDPDPAPDHRPCSPARTPACLACCCCCCCCCRSR